MGDTFSTPQDYNHVLLLGLEEQGKTKFLYENLLENRWKGTIASTEGYNYEVIKADQQHTFGIWDLGGSVEVQQVWKVFYKFIPFKAWMFVVRYSLDYKIKKKQSDQIARSRKCLHNLAHNQHFKGKPLFLIINIENDAGDATSEEEREKRRRDAAETVLNMLLWAQLEVEHKHHYYLNLTNQVMYEQLWYEFLALYKKVYKTE